ncbi:hypothetical protein SH611_18135 [Geminicoccaceae bacterium 1502E]|nr:hypothetical protein [Geminicoccaceae bacterium 1502E]
MISFIFRRCSAALAVLLSAVSISACTRAPEREPLSIHVAAMSGIGSLPGGGAAAPADAEQARAPLRLSWPGEAEALVVEESHDSVVASRTRYVLTAMQAVEEGVTVLKASNMSTEVFETGPEKSVDALVAEAVVAAMAQEPIGIRFGSDGAFRGVEGDVERLLDITHGLLADEPTISEFFGIMRKERVLETQIERLYADIWNGLVGAWVGLDLSSSGERTIERRAQADGRTVPQLFTLRNLGPDAACDGCIRLQMVAETRGAEAAAAVSAETRKLADGMLRGAAARRPGLSEARRREALEVIASVDDVARVTTVDLVTEAATLLPHSMLMETTTSVTVQGKRHSQARWLRLEFSWR